MAPHIIIGDFVQLVMHVIITIIRKDISGQVCRLNSSTDTTATIYENPSAIAAIHGFPTFNCTTGITEIPHAVVPLSIHGHRLTALIDSCTSDSDMSENIAKMLKLKIKPSTRNISMTLELSTTHEHKNCCVIDLNGRDYKNVRLSLLEYLCSDVILGHNFQKQCQHLFYLGVKVWSSNPLFQLHHMRCFFPIYKQIANV